MVLSDILEYLHSTDPGFMLECFVASGKTAVIEALTSLSFRNVHTTVTLHNTLERV
jgi:hypothetical protein